MDRGPYRRTVDLPVPVDVHRANATFDNGALVLMLPLAPQPTSGAIVVPKVGSAKGMLIRHVGLEVRAPASRP